MEEATLIAGADGADHSQIEQTVEMFEAISATQPLDVQSLEILREAYGKLGRDDQFIGTSRRIAEAYVEMGQYSSAILEYEGLLQRVDDPQIRAALVVLEAKASGNELDAPATEETIAPVDAIDDGRAQMWNTFVGGRELGESDFETHWQPADFGVVVKAPTPPFIQNLADKSILPIEKSLSILAAATKLPYLPLERYDFDMELARTFSREACLRWCVLPFDRFGKNLLVATANPFNRHAAEEIGASTNGRVLWYLAAPAELIKALQKVFR